MNNKMTTTGGVKSVGAVFAELVPVIILALIVNYVFLNPIVDQKILDNAASVSWTCQEEFTGSAKVDKEEVEYSFETGKTYECKMGDKYFKKLLDSLQNMKGRKVQTVNDQTIQETFIIKAGTETHKVAFGSKYIRVDDQWYRIYAGKFTAIYCFK